jgi:hypothetical protein
MRKTLVLAGALMALGASSARAQQSYAQCDAAQLQLRDGCYKAVDLFNYMAPQLGTVLAGGNATLGQGGTLGGLPHFAVSVRGNALQGSLPKVENIALATTGQVQSSFEVSDQPLGLPSVDAAVGVFGGIPIPMLTKVGGVDLLLSASYVPEYSSDNISIATPDGGLKMGYGLRVGLLQESMLVPGVSATWFKRDLPTANVVGVSGDDSISVNDLAVKTTAWRVTASKNLFIFGLAAGVGQDKYESDASLSVSVQDGANPRITGTPFAFDQSVTRTNYFVDLSFNLLLAKVVGEIGMVSGGEIPTYNSFAKKADDSRLYGSVGLRIGL